MTRSVLLLIAVLTMLAASSCGGGVNGQLPLPDPLPADGIIAVAYGDNLVRIYAAPGSVDPGSTIQTSGGAVGVGTASADGAVLLDAIASGTGGALSISYTRGGVQSTTSTTISTPDSRAELELAATGAAPNDIAADDTRFYVANSADNTVAAYTHAGVPDATSVFDTGSSPSYLALAGDTLWVTNNGSNVIAALDTADIAADPAASYALDAGEMAFLGPGRVTVTGDHLLVPVAGITAFGAATEYADGALIAIDTNAGTQEQLAVGGVNVTSAVYDAARSQVYVLATGSIQFDEFWMPYADSDSVLSILSYPALTETASINLGPVGASGLAVDGTNGLLLIGSMLAANLYTLDLDSNTLQRDQSNPVELTPEFSYVSGMALQASRGFLFCSSFNTDEVHAIGLPELALNPGPYPAPMDVALNPELMAGAGALALSPDGSMLFVLHGIANAVSRITLY